LKEEERQTTNTRNGGCGGVVCSRIGDGFWREREREREREIQGSRAMMASSWWWLYSAILIVAVRIAAASIPTTLEGPFQPVTVKFDPSLRQGSSDLSQDDPRIVKQVSGNFPEQISLALSTPDAMWITWITGMSRLPFYPFCLCIQDMKKESKSFWITRRTALRIPLRNVHCYDENLGQTEINGERNQFKAWFGL